MFVVSSSFTGILFFHRLLWLQVSTVLYFDPMFKTKSSCFSSNNPMKYEVCWDICLQSMFQIKRFRLHSTYWKYSSLAEIFFGDTIAVSIVDDWLTACRYSEAVRHVWLNHVPLWWLQLAWMVADSNVVQAEIQKMHWHIEAETKWTQFRRRHFQVHFIKWKCLNSD